MMESFPDATCSNLLIMKITITPSEDQTRQKYKHYGVAIEYPADDVDCHIALQITVNALIAWGFERDAIIKAMEKYEL
jgi:hypothetical protein